ncbi:hypothetical protein Taro_051225 [Colocasia esculenta]|uniref:Uncharacterized protein n=1 Tax=Colocasia esculenta TaxID=4460 RepID=A0A843XFH8_COLES|nr:hypothetical protein [Colocasia esculenta]
MLRLLSHRHNGSPQWRGFGPKTCLFLRSWRVVIGWVQDEWSSSELRRVGKVRTTGALESPIKGTGEEGRVPAEGADRGGELGGGQAGEEEEEEEEEGWRRGGVSRLLLGARLSSLSPDPPLFSFPTSAAFSSLSLSPSVPSLDACLRRRVLRWLSRSLSGGWGSASSWAVIARRRLSGVLADLAESGASVFRS